MTPKGILLLIGGAEDKGDECAKDSIRGINKEFQQFEILKELIPKRPHNRHIEIITTATEDPDDAAKRYTKAFTKLGLGSELGFMHVVNRQEANNPELLDRIKKCHTVFFSGGDQYRLTTILGSSALIKAINEKYYHDDSFIVAGTSAGAMAAGNLMVYEGDAKTALLKGQVKISSGLGFISGCLIDTHFLERGRFSRLTEATITNPGYIGFGLGEDTALIIKGGNHAECRGSGMVVVIDGQHIKHTNIAYAEDCTPICIENLVVHVMARGNAFLLRERLFVPRKEDLKHEQHKISHLKN